MSNNKEKHPLVLLPYCANDVSDMKRIAKDKGLAVEVIKEDDIIPQIIEEYKPSHILGVACPKKVRSVGKYLDSISQPYTAIPLNCDGVCFKISGVGATVDMDRYKAEIEKLSE